MPQKHKLPEWADYLAILQKAEVLLEQLPDSTDDEQKQELYRLMFAAIATGYHSAFTAPGSPDFVPAVSSVLNTIGVNPDFIYGYTQLDGTGTYRLSGCRGDEVFVLIDLTAGGFGVLDQLGPSVGMIDIDKLQQDSDGNFSVLLSAERPAGHRGEWLKIDPHTKTATSRKAYYDWGNSKETRLAIERLDEKPSQLHLTAAETARRLTLLSEYVQRYVGFAVGYCKGQRDKGLINKLEHDDWAGKGGLAGQHYYQGIFQLAAGEAMIVETELPQTVRYWNIQINDSLWNTIDWFNHQSSLNASQAHLDKDGKFRAVISAQDPGVANWLDTAGRQSGSLMLRWTEASSGPVPSLKIVPLSDVLQHLPSDTHTLGTEQRSDSLRQRHRSAQLRRRW